jgi:phosphoglycerol transferase MdoB-like AlkP superfamily enzyme
MLNLVQLLKWIQGIHFLNSKTTIMKQLISLRIRSFYLLVTAMLFQGIAMAQDSTVQTTQTNTNSTTSETTWTVQPWMWVVGGVVVLLILIALFRGKSTSTSSDRVVVTKTVERDTDV